MPKIAGVRGSLAALLLLGCSGASASKPETDLVPPAATWLTTFDAEAAEMHPAADGGVVVRLTESPWLVRHDANGRPNALAVETALDWALGFVNSDDGSLYVAGTIRSGEAADDAHVRVDHLSPSGRTLAAQEWSVPGASGTSCNGIGLGPDGAVYVLATTSTGRSLVRLGPDGELADALAVPVPLGQAEADFAGPQRLALAPDGSYLMQGGTRDLWLERATLAGDANDAWGLLLDQQPADDAIYAGGMLRAAQGGWFVAVGSGSSDESGRGFYHRGVLRLSEDGRRLWGQGDFFEPSAVTDAAALRRVSLALLEDSVLLATAKPSGVPLNDDDILLDADEPETTLVRYSLKGDFEQAYALGGILDAAAVGSHAALFLGASPDRPHRYSLLRIDFDALSVPLAAQGAACSVSADCAAGACCASATGLRAVTCRASERCTSGDFCSDDAQCSGKCVLSPSGAGLGFCSAPCQASLDCPRNAACIDEQCFAVCGDSSDCPYRGNECTAVTSAEAQQVSVCSPVSAAQSL